MLFFFWNGRTDPQRICRINYSMRRLFERHRCCDTIILEISFWFWHHYNKFFGTNWTSRFKRKFETNPNRPTTNWTSAIRIDPNSTDNACDPTFHVLCLDTGTPLDFQIYSCVFFNFDSFFLTPILEFLFRNWDIRTIDWYLLPTNLEKQTTHDANRGHALLSNGNSKPT